MKVSKEDRERFYEACEFYGCGKDEIEEIKIAADNDPQAWRDCFDQLWQEVKSVKFMGRAGK